MISSRALVFSLLLLLVGFVIVASIDFMLPKSKGKLISFYFILFPLVFVFGPITFIQESADYTLPLTTNDTLTVKENTLTIRKNIGETNVLMGKFNISEIPIYVDDNNPRVEAIFTSKKSILGVLFNLDEGNMDELTNVKIYGTGSNPR